MYSLLILSAAAAAQLPAAEQAAFVVPKAFQEAAAGPSAAPVRMDRRWWTIFADPQLDALIARGDAANSDVAIAAARVSMARAALRGAEAERMPRVNGFAAVASQTGTLINAAGGSGSVYQIGANASYELDLLGRLSKSARAARLDAEAAEAMLDSARLIAEADIAQAYFNLRGLDDERAVLAAAVADGRDAVAIAEHRERDGLGTTLDSARLRGELGTIEADLAALDRQRAAAEHALALLIGSEGSIALAPWTAAPVPEVPAGLPSDLLLRRPDVAASADAIRAAQLRLRSTQAAWFPAISLTGGGGEASPSLGNLLSSTAQTFGFNLLLSLPIFDGGRHKAAVRKSKAEVELSQAENGRAVLRAFREVEDQLSAVRLLRDEEAAAERNVAADLQARRIAEQRYDQGAISRLELIDLRRRGLAAARRLAEVRQSRYVAAVNLVRALGGGWSAPRDGAPALALAN